MHDALVPSVVWVAPFAAMLLAIAVCPFVVPKLWESNLGKLGVSVALGLPVVVRYALYHPAALGHAAHDYVSFVLLLGCLFVVSGGIVITGDIQATPRVNAAFLAVGAVLASIIGTTGASMLLVRPVLTTNRERRFVTHTLVFFIFIVSNAGGCLTPLGDPPLFLGYLLGVPFTWTLRLLPHWLFINGLLLAIFYVWDLRMYRREAKVDLDRDRTHIRPLHLLGRRNLLFLVAVVAGVALLPPGYRELALLVVAWASWKLTPRRIHEANRFTFHAITEVAILFVGIFATMLPALEILHARGASLGVRLPWHFFWTSGLLSSFLDNAPTYLTFLAIGQSLGLRPDVVGVPHEILTAISVGSVFMGANSYIGNGPNFMVKSIAEERGVAMPSFGRYLLYSGGILVPCFVLVTLIFFR